MKIPGLKFNGSIGDYFTMLESHCSQNKKRKVVMCLGANIGNMTIAEGSRFCSTLRSYLGPGDQCIIGFDLIRHVAIENRFAHTTEFLDSKSWFMDAIWTAI